MTLNCIIIDDEQPARRLLENYCNKHENLSLIASYKSALEALDILSTQSIDILFLDIQMPDISGIDLVKSLGNYRTNIIFTTAYREYALEAFELNAVDYILKPIAFPRFVNAIEKVKSIHSLSIQTIKNSKIKKIVVKADKKQYKVAHQDILYIKSENEYIHYHTIHQGNLLVHGALKKAHEYLDNHETFVRIHRSYIININHIDFLEGNRVSIKNKYLPISDSYKDTFMEIWNY